MEDVTLLLTIYNRRKFTLKWIDFYLSFNSPFKLYICDGGNDKFLQKKLENISKRNKKIIYKKYNYYKNFENLFEKHYLATQKIKSKYIYLCEDDDFLIFDNIKKSVNFLNENEDYACSGGQSFNMEILNKNFFLGRPEHILNNISFEETSKFKRVNHLLFNMQSNWNCLHRTINLRKIFFLINQTKFENYLASELLFVLSSIFYGKVKRFKHIEYIKIDNTLHSSSSIFSKEKDYLKILSSKKYSYENFIFIRLYKKYFKKAEQKIIIKNLSEFLIKINNHMLMEIYPSFKNKLKIVFRNIIKKILLCLRLFNIFKIILIKMIYQKTNVKNIYAKTLYTKKLINKDKIFFEKLRKFY